MDAKRYCKWVVGGTLAVLFGVVLFNVLVDPYRVYPQVHLKIFDRLRDSIFSRVARAELVRRGDWDMIILGTSRPKAGMPSRHPAFATNRICNLSVDAALMSESEIIFNYTRARNPIRRVVLCLDFALMRPQKVDPTDFSESRFNPQLSLFDYHAKHLLGAKTLDRSFEFFRSQLRGKMPPENERDGFNMRSLKASTVQRTSFDKVLNSLAFGYTVLRAQPSEMESFRRLIRTTQAEDIELTLAINPVHALDLELLRAGRNWERFEAWRSDLVRIVNEESPDGRVALWDFSGYAGPTTEEVPPPGDRTTRMKYYFENSHYTPALGALMMDRMFSGATNDFGVRLTAANIEAHTRRIREQREAYARTHAREIQWVEGIVRQVLAARKRPAASEETE